MTNNPVRIYTAGLPDGEPYSSVFFSESFLKVKFSIDEGISPEEEISNAIFLLQESVLTENVNGFVKIFSQVERNVPLIIIGESYSQEYLENLFPNRPFTYLKSNLTIDSLCHAIDDAIRGETVHIPIHDFQAELENARNNIRELHSIGIALSAENDLDKLLDLILTKSRLITQADAGSLYLVEGKNLRFKLSQNASLAWSAKENSLIPIDSSSISGYSASAKSGVNILDAYLTPSSFPFTFNASFDQTSGYRTKAILAVPMKNHLGEVLGVIQLINKRLDFDELIIGEKVKEENLLPFRHEDTELLSSLASQAAVAIENVKLYQDIKNLFEGFVKASIFAIESRDPTTKGHSERVAELSISLAKEINQQNDGPFAKNYFKEKHLTQLRYASLLHDFGKVGVREEVLIKAKKLFPHELENLKNRFKYIRKSIEADFYQECLNFILENGVDRFNIIRPSLEAGFREKIDQVRDTLEFLVNSNEPSVLEEGNFNRLVDIAKLQHLDIKGQTTPFLTEREMHVLSIRRGSLSESERIEIESHVTHTFNFLSKIPWTQDLKRIPEIAYGHHEKLNGRGYPNHLQADFICFESQMMAVCDIFDALTAQDRPYKPAVPLKKAIDILYFDVNSNHINKELVDLFVKKEVYRSIEGRTFK